MQKVGWRLPFFLAIITLFIAQYFRKNISETELFLNLKRRQEPMDEASIISVIKKNKKNLLVIMGLYSLSSVITYLVFVFMPVYASSILNLSFSETSSITTIAIGCVTLGVPFAGSLSDKIGRKPCLYLGSIGFSILSYPLYRLMTMYNSMSIFILAEIIFVLMAIIYQGVLTSAAQEMPSTADRYRVTSFAYNISYALFGGTAPFVVTYFSGLLDTKVMPGIYLFFVGLFSLLAVFNMKETHKKVLL
jgi:MHS family proline/betaine transporter-like MFS transporter